MNNAPLFQGFPSQWTGAIPSSAFATSWPMAIAKAYWFELPVAVANHLQRFAADQAQERMRLLSELTRAEGVNTIFTKEMAFIQQASLAWGAEMMELAELCQEKLLNPVQEEPSFTIPEIKKAA